jgi:hypothetical protein
MDNSSFTEGGSQRNVHSSAKRVRYLSEDICHAHCDVLLLVCVVLVSGQTMQSSPRQAILDYQLMLQCANQLIPAMEAMTKYVMSLPDFQDRVRKSMKMTPAERLGARE